MQVQRIFKFSNLRYGIFDANTQFLAGVWRQKVKVIDTQMEGKPNAGMPFATAGWIVDQQHRLGVPPSITALNRPHEN